MRPQTAHYDNVESLYTERDRISWYWRTTAFLASWCILGGFLTLPAQFDDDAQLRVSSGGLAAFSVTILTIGFALTALLTYAVRSQLFRADTVYLPAFSSSALGLLTLAYNFLSSRRFGWNIAALLTLLAAGTATLAYGGLLLWTQRRFGTLKSSISIRHMSASPSTKHRSLSSSTKTRSMSSESNHDTKDASDSAIYLRNFTANEWPAARAGAAAHADMVTRHRSLGNEPYLAAQTRSQMRTLLQKPLTIPDPAASKIDRQYRVSVPPNETPRWQSPPKPSLGVAPPWNGYYAPHPETRPESSQHIERTEQLFSPVSIEEGGVYAGRDPPTYNQHMALSRAASATTVNTLSSEYFDQRAPTVPCVSTMPGHAPAQWHY